MLNKQIAGEQGLTETEIKGIKNIIFDLGGVIIDIHYNRTIEHFKNLGFENFDTIYTQMKQTHLFDQLETGKIHPHAFRIELQKYQNQLTNEEIDTAWNAMIGEMPYQHVNILQQVRRNYKTFLLSNTNEIHVNYFYTYLFNKFNYNPLPDMFEHTYFSHEIGYRKPDIDAYLHVLKNAGLKPQETLFIDDLAANIKGAKNAGLLTLHLVNFSIQDLFI